MAKVPRFLLSTRWVLLALFTVVIVLVCVRLGLWQLERLEERRTLNAAVEQGLAQPRTTLEDALPENGVVVAEVAYRRVEAAGSYDTSAEALLFGRALDGVPGNHVLTPLRTEHGAILVVDRGWVPLELDEPPVAEAAPPGGRVTVAGVLLPGQGGARSSGFEVFDRVDLSRFREELGPSVLPVFLQLESQDPSQPGDLPRPAPLPELTEGPHLGYAVQWFTFAAIALVGYGALVRREIRDRARSPVEPSGP